MDPFEIYAGENVLIQVPMYLLEIGQTWKGSYDDAAPYVVDDAVLGPDNIGYECILATTGNAPPNPTYWEALEPVPVTQVVSITAQLVQAARVIVNWQYRRISQLAAGPLTVGSKYLIYTFGAGDVFTNVGAGSNAAGVIFTATGITPTTWTHGTILYLVDFPSNFDLQEGLFEAELLADDTTSLNGLFELRMNIATEDAIYIGSHAQSDVLCLPDAIKITPC